MFCISYKNCVVICFQKWKKLKKSLGPLVFFLLITCRTFLKHAKVDLKWHKRSPVFNIFSLPTGNAPFFPQWMDRGVYVLQDFYDDNGLRAFNDLQAE